MTKKPINEYKNTTKEQLFTEYQQLIELAKTRTIEFQKKSKEIYDKIFNNSNENN